MTKREKQLMEIGARLLLARALAQTPSERDTICHLLTLVDLETKKEARRKLKTQRRKPRNSLAL
jgi:hypothetical protein